MAVVIEKLSTCFIKDVSNVDYEFIYNALITTIYENMEIKMSKRFE